MKKIITVLVGIALASFFSFAQNHIAVQAVPHFAPTDDWSTKSVELNAQFIRDIGSVFHLGAGIGIGTASPVKYWSQYKMDDVEKTEQAMYLPVFIRGKVDFGTKPSHAYFAFKAGTKLCQVEGFDGEGFNPYVANVSPAIGYDIKIGDHKLGIEFVVDAIMGRYQEINFKYNDLTKKYMYENFETKADSMWAGYGIAVTLEF